jgi:hypothetical protein
MTVVVEAERTVSVQEFDVLAVKLLSPPYWAVIVCCPTVRSAMEKKASGLPEDGPSEAVPNGVPPSKKVTVPVGELPAGSTGTTVAVKVMLCPKTAGSILATRPVVEVLGRVRFSKISSVGRKKLADR